ncbi:MAG: hypothetical protein V1918_03330 [Planctomycetota bacterium]
MSMPAMALFTRSLRLEARSGWTYRMRAGILLMTLVNLFIARSSLAGGGAPGLDFFKYTMYGNLVFITLMGVVFFSSAIAEEKEEETLGLLRMTDLSSLAILLGKSTSKVLTALALLLVQLPFTLLAVTLGGVAVRQVLAAYCALLAYIFFLGNFALFASVLARNTRQALEIVGVAILLYFAAGVLAGSLGWSTGLATFFEKASLFARFAEVFTTGFPGGLVGIQFPIHVLAGAFFFLLALFLFDRLTRWEKEAAPSRGFIATRRSRLRFLGCDRVWTGWAIAWKDFYFIGGGGWTMLLQGAIFFVMAVVTVLSILIGRIPISDVLLHALAVPLVGTSSAILGLGSMLLASRLFHEEMRWKTFPALYALPLTLWQIAGQKIAGACLVLSPSLLMLIVGLVRLGLQADPADLVAEPLLGFFFLCSMLGFLLFLLTIVYLSLLLQRGALALALLLFMFLGPFGILIAFASAPLCVALIHLIGRRLRRLAEA